MKKFLLILLSLITTVSLSAKKHDHKSFRTKHFHQNRHSFKDQRAFRAVDFYRGVSRNPVKSALNEPQRLDSIVEYEWTGSDWMVDYKEEYIYNDDGLIIEYKSFLINEASGEWELDDRELYEYDANGNLILLSDYEWDESTLQWYISWKREYAYDANNLLAEYFESQKDDPEDDWYYVWRTTYEYNENNQPVSTLEYINTIGWNITWSTKYTYDDNGNLIKYEEFDDDDAGDWVNEWQETYAYDDNNRVTEYTEYEWNETTEEWENSDHETWEYHGNNNIAVYYDFDWSDTQNDWELSWKEEYEYDDSHDYGQLVLPWFYHDDTPNYMNHRLTEYANYNFESPDWAPAYMGFFYYSADQATAIKDFEKYDISYFPNPATSEIIFKFDLQVKNVRLEIYNATGNIVQEQSVRSNETVNVQSLSGGIYLFRLLNDKNEIFFGDKILIK